jgi:hypothetical protein
MGLSDSAHKHRTTARIGLSDSAIVVGGNEQCGVAETQISQARAFKF